jgi:hypothetical protein
MHISGAQVSNAQSVSSEQAGSLEDALKPIQAALADLQSSQAVLQEAVKNSKNSGDSPTGYDALQGVLSALSWPSGTYTSSFLLEC